MKYATTTYGTRRGRNPCLDDCRKKFLYFFPGGFADENYLAWERDYKWDAHRRWAAELGRDAMGAALDAGDAAQVAATVPRRQTRVLTWPVATVFGFLARPKVHMFVKPMVTKRAAAACDFEFRYQSRPNWDTYGDVLAMARAVRAELADLRPRDMIDAQSFLWVQGSDEYP